MESDADWDMRIHQSMESLAPGVRKIADFPFDKNINKVNAREQPYGDGWDLIWLGHCGMNAVGNTRQYSFDDPSTQPARFEFKIWDSFNNYQHPVGTRAVFQVHAGVCSTGYAVSQAGARKLIKHFKEVDNPIDLKLSNICKEAYDMMCVGVYPMIISNCDSASNIEDVDSLDDWKAHQAAANKKGPARNPGHSIQISARVNAPMVLDHNAGPEEWRYQYDGVWVAGPDGVRYQVPANTTGTKDLPADKRVAN